MPMLRFSNVLVSTFKSLMKSGPKSDKDFLNPYLSKVTKDC